MMFLYNSHLYFANGMVLFCNALESNVEGIKFVMRTYEMVSGLEINLGKGYD